jgi:RND superfamily putative drug exporter
MKFPSDGGIPALVVFHSGQQNTDLTEALGSFTKRLKSDLAPAKIGSIFSPTDSPVAGATLISPSGNTAMVVVGINGAPSDDDFQDIVDWIIAESRSASSAYGIQSAVTGPAGITNDAVKVFKSIDLKVTLFTVILVLGLLMLIYRSPVLAIVPLIITGTSLMLAQSISAFLAKEFGLALNQQVTSIMSILVFGAGTNYTLFIVSRYREELTFEPDRWAAMRNAMSKVGPSIAGSATTTIVAMSALSFASLGSFKSLGPMLAMAIAVVLISGLFIVPAAVTLLGRWAFWPTSFLIPSDRTGKFIALTLGIILIPLLIASIVMSFMLRRINNVLSAKNLTLVENNGVWDKAGRLVSSRPRVIFSITMIGIILATLPAWSMKPSYNFLDGFPDDAESKVGYSLLSAAFPPGQLAPSEMLVENRNGLISESYDSLADLSNAIDALEGVAGVTGPTRPIGISVSMQDAYAQRAERFISPDGTTARIEILLSEDPYSSNALEMINTIRNLAGASELGRDVNHQILIGGSTALQTDTKAAIVSDISWLAPVSLLAIFLVLVVLLQSVVAPLYLVFSVIASFGATFGIAIFTFQNILSHSGVAYSTGVWMFIFLVALGADYNIFVMSRIREAVKEEGMRAGIATAVGRTGGVITSAGIILAGTFAVLTTLPLRDLFQLGFAVMLGVLIDTFIVRAFLVPSMTAMLGRWSWWPRQEASVNK